MKENVDEYYNQYFWRCFMGLIDFFFVELLKQIWEDDVKTDQKDNLMDNFKKVREKNCYDSEIVN
jgi:hypothetical protein